MDTDIDKAQSMGKRLGKYPHHHHHHHTRESLYPFSVGYFTRPSCPGLERSERGRNRRHQLVHSGVPYVMHMLVAAMLYDCASTGTNTSALCTNTHLAI